MRKDFPLLQFPPSQLLLLLLLPLPSISTGCSNDRRSLELPFYFLHIFPFSFPVKVCPNVFCLVSLLLIGVLGPLDGGLLSWDMHCLQPLWMSGKIIGVLVLRLYGCPGCQVRLLGFLLLRLYGCPGCQVRYLGFLVLRLDGCPGCQVRLLGCKVAGDAGPFILDRGLILSWDMHCLQNVQLPGKFNWGRNLG